MKWDKDRIKNEIGKRYGRLSVTAYVGIRITNNNIKRHVFLFTCDCGSCIEKDMHSVMCNLVRSCGCLLREHIISVNLTHGQSYSRAYRSWNQMKNRCYNEKIKHYPLYGGRGISVCERWKDSFENFIADMGDRPDLHTLDRIDPNGNYDPSNCRWASVVEQNNNRRNTRKLVLNGVELPLCDWARKYNISPCTVRSRLASGASVEEALTRDRNFKHFKKRVKK